MSHFWTLNERKALNRFRKLLKAGEADQAVHNVVVSFPSIKALKAFLVSVSEDADVAARFIPLPYGHAQPKKKHWHYALDVQVDEEDETSYIVTPQVRIPPPDLLYLVRALGGEWEDLV